MLSKCLTSKAFIVLYYITKGYSQAWKKCRSRDLGSDKTADFGIKFEFQKKKGKKEEKKKKRKRGERERKGERNVFKD